MNLPFDLMVRVCQGPKRKGTSRREKDCRMVKGCGIQGEAARRLSGQDAPPEAEDVEVKK